MKILIFHPTLLPPKDYGGTERVLLWLARGLQERGHEVWVAAHPGSQLPDGIRLVEVPRERSSPLEWARSGLPPGLDVVHFFTPPGNEAMEALSCASVLTLHGNGQPGEKFPRNTVFVSRDHAVRHGGAAFVYNGIDPSEYLFEPQTKNQGYLFLSKTSWKVKNLEGALRRCRKAGVSLRIAGGNRPLGLRMQVRLQGLLGRDPAVTWEGPVAGRRKALLLAQAKAFLFPVTWPEPFGVVVAEALISGTPVIASRQGSLPELVSPEVGVLADTDDEWVEWLQKDRLPWDPEACRARAMEKFHFLKMAENYEGVYRRVISGEKLNEREPVAREWRIG